MELNMCEKGHYWNPADHSSCPTCSGNFGATVPLQEETLEKTVYEGLGKTIPVPNAAVAGGEMILPTQPVVKQHVQEEGKTVPIGQIDGVNGKIFPIVGWFVCIDGAEKGKDYRLHSGYNHIGRDAKMDVYIRGDEQISREGSAWIAYDELGKQYLFGAGNGGTNFVYLNNAPVPLGQSAPIHAFDTVLVGKTRLVFVPLCGKDFDWTQLVIK